MPETPCDTQTLQALLEEAYAVTYRDSSLEVRRRYRKLICHLERRNLQGSSLAKPRTTAPTTRSRWRAEHAGRAHKPD